jgi:hypothetical protein
VYLGLGLIKWGTAAALAALAFFVLAVLAAQSHQPAVTRASVPPEDHLGPLAVAITSALSAVCSLLGRLCCCSVPSQTGARLPAVLALFGTLLAQVLAGFVALGIVLVAVEGVSPLWLVPAALASCSAALLAEVLFLVSLYQVGHFLQEPAVGRRILLLAIGTAVIVVGVVFAVLFLATSAAAPVAAGRPPSASPLAWLAGPLGAALVLVLYMDLINFSRRALARRFARDCAGDRRLSGVATETKRS